MQITFGIITDGKNPDRITQIVKSIDAQNIPRHDSEIIVIGGDYSYWNHEEDLPFRRLIPFDETIKPGWITKKKNILTAAAQFDNIVYAHDYISFAPGWYEGFCKFGNDWDIAMNRLHNPDGTRFRDWVTWNDARHGRWWYQHEPWCPPEGKFFLGSPCIVPYEYKRTHNMYISGAYWVAKRRVMISEPLNEKLVWGEAEDVEWSLRVRHKFKYVMNTNSTCVLLKQKDPVFPFVELTS